MKGITNESTRIIKKVGVFGLIALLVLISSISNIQAGSFYISEPDNGDTKTMEDYISFSNAGYRTAYSFRNLDTNDTPLDGAISTKSKKVYFSDLAKYDFPTGNYKLWAATYDKYDNCLGQDIVTFYLQSKKTIVVIDPGHGGGIAKPGTTAGTSGIYYGKEVTEREINLKIAKELKQRLEGDSIEVYLTREKDIFVHNRDRASFANKLNADLYISIHCNSNKNTSPRGFTCLYPNNHDSKQSRELANEIYYDMTEFYSYEHFAMFPGHRIPYSSNETVLTKTNMPAVLIENGFMSNKEDLEILVDDKNLGNIANTLAYSIRNWLLNK